MKYTVKDAICTHNVWQKFFVLNCQAITEFRETRKFSVQYVGMYKIVHDKGNSSVQSWKVEFCCENGKDFPCLLLFCLYALSFITHKRNMVIRISFNELHDKKHAFLCYL